MSLLELEPYDTIKARQQADHIRDLVHGEREWLKEYQPETATAYENIWRGTKRVFKFARSQKMEAYVVRKNRVAIGLATIAFDQRVIHPVEGLYEGDDLAYWLKSREDTGTHVRVAGLLVRRGLQIHFGAANTVMPRPAVAPYRATAAIVTGHPNPSIGFDLSPAMTAVGESATLSTDMPKDPFDMACGGRPAQLYEFNGNYQAVGYGTKEPVAA